jgi:hypothetical protein
MWASYFEKIPILRNLNFNEAKIIFLLKQAISISILQSSPAISSGFLVLCKRSEEPQILTAFSERTLRKKRLNLFETSSRERLV